jgi:predicted nucleic acid-binding protein
MMFWDSSALVPILLNEHRSAELTSLLSSDSEPTIWWASPVECRSAIFRRNRELPIPSETLRKALQRLEALVKDVDSVAATETVRQKAGRLLAVHPLRAADALQLASALVWCEDQPYEEKFICLDNRLREAARLEGFDVTAPRF